MSYMKVLLVLLTATITFASTVPNVVLLTSVETPRIWYKKKNWEVHDSLKKKFKKFFKNSGYNIVMKNDVDFLTLREELHNPNNIAVFWASHAAGVSRSQDGVQTAGAVVSINGKDVKELFKSVHPNMRYLGLVGCNAKSLLADYEKKGFYKNNPNLKVHSFKKKVDARIGLKKSMKASVESLGRITKRMERIPMTGKVKACKVLVANPDLLEVNEDIMCADRKGFYVTGRRILEEDSDTVVIRNLTGVSKILPAGKAGDIQEFSFYVPTHEKFRKGDLKLTVDSLIYFSRDHKYLGEFQFNSSWGGRWKVFAKKDGTILGVTKNLYLYQGNIPGENRTKTYKDLSCTDEVDLAM